MMLISTIIAPAGAPQVHRPQLSQTTAFDALDNAILDHVRTQGRYGLTIWTLVNHIASAQNPTSRHDARSIRLQILQRIRRLLKLARLFRVGRIAVSAVRLPKANVIRKRCSYRGSTTSRCAAEAQRSAHKPPRINLLQKNTYGQSASSAIEKTQSDAKT